MELFAVSGLINALTAVSFGVLVFLKNWRARQNQIFLLMTFALAIWGFSYWRWLSSGDADTALFWVRLLGVGSVFIPVFFFDWVTILLQRGKKLRDFVTLAYLGSIAVSGFVLSENFIAGIEPKLWFPFWPNAGVLYAAYFWILYVGVVLWSVHALYHGWRNEREPHRRGQIFYVFWGAVLGFGGGFTNFFLWFDIQIPPYGNFLVAAFPFLLGFSVIRYGLFNAKTIATEILVFFTALILFIQFVLSNSIIEYILRGIFFAAVVALGYLLIRSVYKEVRQREQIEKLAGDLEEANKRQKNLLHEINHDVKEMLTEATGAFSNLLEGDYGVLPTEARALCEAAFKKVRAGTRRVMDFLHAANLEKGTVQFEMKLFNLRQMLEKVLKDNEDAAKEKGLALVMRVEDGEYLFTGDENQLALHVFDNLLKNAIIFTPKGGVVVSLSKRYGKIMVAMKDTGVGITEEDKKNLFTPGGHGKDSMKINVHSTGNGLFIAKSTVLAHGGKIWAESAGASKGAAFFVEVPSVTN